MEAIAVGKYVKQAPRKVRMAADLIRGKDLETALNLLHFANKKSCAIVEKVVRSAVANLMNMEGGSKIKPEEIYIKSVRVDGGPMFKKYRAGSMGRAMIMRRRTSHVTVVVAAEEKKAQK